MQDSRNGFRKFLQVQVESLQDQLSGLERDPAQIEYLKSILRICQRLRHAREADEPEAVRILRNAVEKVTLHLGREDLAVSQEVLDFYVDTFDLLEEGVRRWPSGPAFDRARYADRVRSLLETTAPRRPPLSVMGVAPSGAPFDLKRGDEAAESVPVAGPGVAEAALPGLQDVPTWTEPTQESRLELVSASDLTLEEREQFAEADLRDLLAVPWRGLEREGEEAGTALAAEGAGGLAASFSDFEALRARLTAYEPQPVSAPPTLELEPEARAAIDRVQEVMDEVSLSLQDLDRVSEDLLSADASSLDRGALSTLVERLQIERDNVAVALDRIINRLSDSVTGAGA